MFKQHMNLSSKLIFSIFLSLILALLFLVGLRFFGDSLVAVYFDGYYQREADAAISEFIDFVETNHLDLKKDQAVLNKWIDEFTIRSSTAVALYDDNGRHAFSTSSEIVEQLIPSFPITLDYLEGNDIARRHDLLVDLPSNISSDGTWSIVFYGYKQYFVYWLTHMTETILSIAAFILIFLLMTRSKMRYLKQLDQEIERMKDGVLEEPITVAGSDELSRLAANLEELRKTLLNQILTEAEAKKANSELITAMSHDLRTPLTALMGYLEIVSTKRCHTEEQFERYLDLSEKKARQIKALSDRLFEYFFVFGTDELLTLEPVDGQMLLSQLTGEHLPGLMDQGFTIDATLCEEPILLELNIPAIHRIFDNLFSNLLKYADPRQPVKLFTEISSQRFIIQLINTRRSDTQNNGTGIGLKSCLRLAEKQHAEFLYKTIDGHFAVTLSIPICPSI